MNITVSGWKSLRGQARLPGDKSISHRALLLGAISHGRSLVENFLPAEDCLATLKCIQRLGVQVERFGPASLAVYGQGLRSLREPEDVLDAGGSGTTMRLLAGILAGQPFYSVLTGNASLRRRPMDRVAVPLRQMGAEVLGRERGRFPPLSIRGGDLKGLDYALPVASAQVKSCLLLAGLYANGLTVVREPAPTRDHTERMLRARGAKLVVEGPVVGVEPASTLKAMDVQVPGDFSSAAFLIVAACIMPGSEVLLEGVGVNPTRLGLWEVLRRMGMEAQLQNEREVSGEPVADILVRTSSLSATEVGGEEIPRLIDELPILAVAATQAEGCTMVRDAAELRVKESDRVATIVSELGRLGAHIEERPDGFIVEGPTPLSGARVQSHGDHRLAMSLAVAGLIAEGETTIEGAECIQDSFPDFMAVLEGLRA